MKRLQKWAWLTAFALACHSSAGAGGAVASYTGKVVDSQGHPAADAAVDCYLSFATNGASTTPEFGLQEHAVTDSEGRFTVPAGEGTAIAVVKKEGLAAGWKIFGPGGGPAGEAVVLTTPSPLAGLVVDGDGQPVEDAEVWVSLAAPASEGAGFSREKLIRGRPARDTLNARTAADGRFRIANFPANMQADLSVRKAGKGQRLRANLDGALAYVSGQQAIKLTLDTPGSIEGTVTVEGTGAPLAGVKLRWMGAGGGLAGPDTPEPAVSGADGAFRIADVAPGEAAVAAEFAGESVPDWVAEDVFVKLAAGETRKDVQVRAGKGGVVALTVLSQGRQPLANAYIYASSSQSRLSAWAETGADGVARLRVPVGNWTIAASKEGWNTGQITLTIASGQSYEQETYLIRALKVAGTVRDASGAPVAGAKVSVNPNFGNNREVETDADGRYEMQWQPSGFGFGMNGQSYWLMARSAERKLVARHAIEETTANLDLVLQPGLTLTAMVQDAGGNPVANAMGNVMVMNGNNGFGWNEPLQSDAGGRMEASGVVPGESYTLSVNATGYGSATKAMRAPSQQTNLLTFPVVVLPKANQKLSGQVLGPNGKPLAGANVNIQGEGQPYGQTITDAQGRFSFEAVCEGPVRLYANSQGGAGNFMNGNFEARGGDTNVVIRFAINGQGGGPEAPIMTTSGRVLDPSGAPVAGARLSVLPAFGINTEITSEDDGKYSLAWQKNNFGGGENPFIFVLDTDRHLAVTYELEETTSNLDLRLQPAMTLSVKAQDAQGKPVSNATANLMIWTGNSAFSFGQSTARANEQGVMEFHDLPPGRHYSASISAKGYGSATVQAQAGQTRTNHFIFRPAVLKAANLKLAGQVLGPDNKPVARAYVNLNGDGQPNGNVTTDATGHFSFEAVCEGRIQLSANTSGNGSPNQYGNAEAQGGDTNVLIHFGINGMGSRRNTQVVTTSGKVLDASGAPVGGASLSVMPPNGMAIQVKSEDDGKYSITWQKRNFGGGQTQMLFVRDTARHLAAAHDLDEVTTNLDLRLEPALTLAVKVQDAQGKPIPSATANLYIRSGNTTSSVGQMPDSADDRGVIEFPDLPQERGYSANISAKGYGSVTLQAQAGQTKTTHFDFPAAVLKAADRKLAGKVLGPNSKPVAGANVNMQGDGQPFGQTTTDADGHFSFDAVCEGPVRLFANHQGDGAYLNSSIETRGGDTNVVIRFTVNGQGGGPNARTVTTSGKIMDASGAPIGGARLTVMPPNGTSIEVKSDPDGTYSMTWQKNNFGGGQNTFILVHDTEHHLAVAHDLDETTTNLDLRLQPALTLAVKVQDAQGKPIPSATASLLIRFGNSASSLGQMPDSADDLGIIEFSDLPQERGYSANISARGYGSATVEAQVADTKTNHFDLPVAVLKVADRKLAGKVLGPDGKPVAGANVNMQGDGQPFGQSTTDAAGHFSFDAVCEGPVRLYANHQGDGAYLNADIQTQGGDTNVVIRFTANGQGGAPNSRTVTTSGRVLSPAGAPVAGVLLAIEPGSGMNMELKSDAEGKFSITWQEQNAMSLPVATATPARGAPAAMRHSLVGRDLEHHWAAAVAVDDQTTNVDLPLQEALTISGSVQDPDGGPVKNATVRAILFSGTASGLIGGPQPATVDAHGAFSVGVLPPGQQYSLSVTAPGYGFATQRVQPDETQTNRLLLPPFTLKVANLKLAGQVVDADGQPVAGVRVTLQGDGQTPGSAITDAKGHFAYDSVCQGEVVLSVASRNRRGGRPSYQGRAQARGGDTNVVVKLDNN